MKNIRKFVLTTIALLFVSIMVCGCGLLESYTVYTGTYYSSNWSSDKYSKNTYSESEAESIIKSLSPTSHSYTLAQIKNYLDNAGFSSSQASELASWLVAQDYADIEWTNSSSSTVYYILKTE